MESPEGSGPPFALKGFGRMAFDSGAPGGDNGGDLTVVAEWTAIGSAGRLEASGISIDSAGGDRIAGGSIFIS